MPTFRLDDIAHKSQTVLRICRRAKKDSRSCQQIVATSGHILPPWASKGFKQWPFARHVGISMKGIPGLPYHSQPLSVMEQFHPRVCIVPSSWQHVRRCMLIFVGRPGHVKIVADCREGFAVDLLVAFLHHDAPRTVKKIVP